MIIFLYGEDTFRSRQKLKEIKDKFAREVDPAGSSLTVVDGENAGLNKITEAASASSLFSRKRMIVVENIFANKNKIAVDGIYDFLKKNEKSQENILVFWDETSGAKLAKNKLFSYLSKPSLLNKNKLAQNFTPLSNMETAEWIKAAVKTRDGRISQKGILALVSSVGNNLWQLNNEIDKLVNYKKGVKPELIAAGQIAEIEDRDVAELTRGKIDENIFALTDAIGARNKGLALELLTRELEAGVADSYLLFMVIRQFKILLQVRTSLDQGQTSRQIATNLKIHPFVVQKSLSQVRNFSVEILKKAFSELIELDRKMKTGKADFVTGLELLLVKI